MSLVISRTWAGAPDGALGIIWVAVAAGSVGVALGIACVAVGERAAGAVAPETARSGVALDTAPLGDMPLQAARKKAITTAMPTSLPIGCRFIAASLCHSC
jgi:hypothetical protein